jgi:ppGpp synthetase/RelA/SpoT-type nucleotidyltranferase
MTRDEIIEGALAAYDERHFELSTFLFGVSKWFEAHPRLRQSPFPIVHSVKTRMKDRTHLADKLLRKAKIGEIINADNLFVNVTDLAGIRVFHLYQEQFRSIHEEILVKSHNLGDWHIAEPPKAYTWDPESKKFFESLGVETEVKESFYTSVHYLIRPRPDSPICCEIQVRTLFEEIWGEVDHSLNYPHPCDNIACREQLRVLAKLVGAGSRLVDSIFRTASEQTVLNHGKGVEPPKG